MKFAPNIVIRERAVEVGTKFVLCENATVRSIASSEGLSKSTVHKDLTERLREAVEKGEADPVLYNEVRKKLDINKQERHIRGGEATRQKVLRMRQGV